MVCVPCCKQVLFQDDWSLKYFSMRLLEQIGIPLPTLQVVCVDVVLSGHRETHTDTVCIHYSTSI